MRPTLPGSRHRPARRLLAVVALLALTYGVLLQDTQLQRSGIDLLLPLAEHFTGERPEPPIAVVVIDEETYRRPPFKDTPQAVWTPFVGEVLQAIDQAGAAVVGLDLVYPTSIDRPELIPGYDLPFLRALKALGRADRLVLGRTQSAGGSVEPYPSHAISAGAGNLRPVNIMTDADEVVRRYPAGFPGARGETVTSFAVELARRVGVAPPTADFLIDFAGNPANLPLYSLTDLLHCSRAGNADLLRQRFADRVVLIGTALDVEDLHLTARRLTAQRAAPPPAIGCSGIDPAGVRLPARRATPGVLIHAAAVETLLSGRIPVLAPAPVNAALVGGTAALLVLVLLRLPPLSGAAVALGACAVAYGVAVLCAARGLILPFLDIAIAAALAYVATYAYRFVVEQDARGWITRQFGRYVSPTVVRQLAERRDGPALDGETRAVTIAFFDIAGFTTLSERLQHAPRELLEIANLYLGRMAEVIEAHGGYVDKFIGDGIMAIWGAPDDDPDAAVHAVDAALACQRTVVALNEERTARDPAAPRLRLRVGINSGTAIVGNVGSRDRVNYTALGDMVNLASRLESVNKEFGTQILIGETTRRLLGGRHVVRRLGRIAVRGKEDRIRAYEVLDAAGEDDRPRLVLFRNALATYYRGRIAEAAAAFGELRDVDPAAEPYLLSCGSLLSATLPADWDGSLRL